VSAHVLGQVIGHEAALHTALAAEGEAGLRGTAVVRLGGSPQDAHNEDISSFAPREWEEVVAWMRSQLRLDRSE